MGRGGGGVGPALVLHPTAARLPSPAAPFVSGGRLAAAARLVPSMLTSRPTDMASGLLAPLLALLLAPAQCEQFKSDGNASMGVDSPVRAGSVNATGCSSANVTLGACCARGASIGSFAGNSSALCCAACANDTRCATWNLGVTSNGSTCSLFPSCSLGQGNCTRGTLRPPAPPAPPPPGPPSPPKPPPGGLSFRFVATWRGVHANADADALSPESAVGDCTCSLIAPLWIITAERKCGRFVCVFFSESLRSAAQTARRAS